MKLSRVSQSVESRCSIRVCCKLPLSLGPGPSNGLDEIGGWGTIPSLEQLGVHERTASQVMFFFLTSKSSHAATTWTNISGLNLTELWYT